MIWYGFAIVICDQRWSACEERTAPVRVVHSDSVVESKATLGVEVRSNPRLGFLQQLRRPTQEREGYVGQWERA